MEDQIELNSDTLGEDPPAGPFGGLGSRESRGVTAAAGLPEEFEKAIQIAEGDRVDKVLQDE